MNKVVLIGNLTRDPELRTTNGGTSVCRFALAVSRRATNEGEREADFINIVVWGNQAENCHKYLKKGSKCAVFGRIQTSSYDAQDGSKRYTTDVIANEVEFISTNRNGGDEGFAPEEPEQEKPKQSSELEEIDDDSLPF